MRLSSSSPYVQSKSFYTLTTQELTIHRVAGLYSVLSLVAKTVPQDGNSKSREQDLSSLMQGCRDVLTALNAILKKNDILGNSSQSSAARAQKAWKRFKWDQEDIQELRSRIISNTSLLSIFTTNLAR
jgi:hypothetical protein